MAKAVLSAALSSFEGMSDMSASSRRLLAVVMMDVVGFTSLTERDEEATLVKWRSLVADHIDPAFHDHGGNVFRKLGDGMLVVFESAHQAVSCVLQIQRALARQGDEFPKIQMRGAIHVGDVTVFNGDLHGNAVNVTARLQEFAAPGGVIVSSAIEELVRGRVSEAIDDMGYLDIRGFERPVHAFSMLERPRMLFNLKAPPPVSTSERPSIAVLPFAEDEARDSTYFGDGIVEEVINSLASIPDLFVVSRNSTLSFRGEAADPRNVRKELGVRYVLTGSVRRAGERIRIMTQLTDCENSSVLWSDRIDGLIGDVFDFQDRVSRQIVTTIAPHLRKAEITRIARKPLANLTAYDSFLRGLDLVYRLDRERFYHAEAMFAQAITLDPSYAAPYAYSALWHAVRIGQGWSPDIAVDQAAVARHANAALERDRLDASSLALCGHVKAILFRDYQEAFTLFDRAVAIGPNSAVAWSRSSPAYSYVGDWKEGRRRALTGLRLSPLDPHVFFTYATLCLAAYTGEQYDEAIEWGFKCFAENNEFTGNMRLLAASLVAAGRAEEAKRVVSQLLVQEPDFNVARFCAGYAYKDGARREQLAVHLRAAGLPG